jgi:hypothetical protein
MLAKAGESKQETYRQGTFGSITIIPYLVAAAANDKIVASDLDTSGINVKVILKRDRGTNVIMNDSLKLLGTFDTLLGNYHEFTSGLDFVYPADGVKNILIRPVTLSFGTSLRVNPGDELIIEVKVSKPGAFGAAISEADSYVEFYANSSVGYEAGIPEVVCEVVQSNATKQSFSLGDSVRDIAVLNFDKDDLSSQVINTLQLSSDRLGLGLSFNQLQAMRILKYGNAPAYRYGTALPVTIANQAIFRALDFLPQSFVVACADDLDAVKLDISFNGANVSASNNYVVCRRIRSSKEIVRSSLSRAQKHTKENYDKLPDTV